MNTKTCKRCGWVYPITQPGNICKICGEPFDIVLCRSCGKVVSGSEQYAGKNLCVACGRKYNNEHSPVYKEKRIEALEARFDAWVANVQQVPKEYPTLTEAQWLEACRFFDGCARCHNDVIDARGFFIGAKLGGRYCDWNVIPLCERCASRWDLTKSVFVNALYKDHMERGNEYRDCLEKIVQYLEVKLDAAINSAANADAPTK